MIPDWNNEFEIMCDASDFAMGIVLGQRIEKIFKAIYYASKTFNEAQENYSTTKKEMLAMVFSYEKFRPYILGSPVIIRIDRGANETRQLASYSNSTRSKLDSSELDSKC